MDAWKIALIVVAVVLLVAGITVGALVGAGVIDANARVAFEMVAVYNNTLDANVEDITPTSKPNDDAYEWTNLNVQFKTVGDAFAITSLLDKITNKQVSPQWLGTYTAVTPVGDMVGYTSVWTNESGRSVGLQGTAAGVYKFYLLGDDINGVIGSLAETNRGVGWFGGYTPADLIAAETDAGFIHTWVNSNGYYIGMKLTPTGKYRFYIYDRVGDQMGGMRGHCVLGDDATAATTPDEYTGTWVVSGDEYTITIQ